MHLLSDEFVVFALHESVLESHIEVPLRVVKVEGVVLERLHYVFVGSWELAAPEILSCWGRTLVTGAAELISLKLT